MQENTVHRDQALFMADPLCFIESYCRDVSKPVPVDIGPTPVFLIADPAGFEHILVRQADRYTKGAEQAKMKSLLGEGLVTSTGERWEASRRSLRTSFSSSGIGEGMSLALSELMRSCADLAAQEGLIVDLHRLAGRIALRMTAAALFREQLTDDEVDTVYDSCVVAHHWLTAVMWDLPHYEGADEASYLRAVAAINAVVDRLLEEPKGIIAHLGPLADTYGKQAVYDEVLTLLVAGFETTATATAYLLYALADHPDLVAWLRPEADALQDFAIDYNPRLLKDAPRGRAFVNEVLRLYPSAWWFARQSLEADEIAGVHIPAGASVFLCPWALHRQPQHWAEPLEFHPARFEVGLPSKFSFMPFGTGSRSCIGQHLALYEMTALLSYIVAAFDVEPMSGTLTDLRPVGGITLGPAEKGMKGRFHIRPPLYGYHASGRAAHGRG
jgi:enediyne biosynthesis protein E7